MRLHQVSNRKTRNKHPVYYKNQLRVSSSKKKSIVETIIEQCSQISNDTNKYSVSNKPPMTVNALMSRNAGTAEPPIYKYHNKKPSKLSDFIQSFDTQQKHKPLNTRNNEISIPFSDWQTKNYKEERCSRDGWGSSTKKEQLEEISINNIKEMSGNMHLPLNIQIRITQNGDKSNKKKMEIKEKIKDRVKEQIEQLIKRNTFSISSGDKTPKKTLCFRPDIINDQIVYKNLKGMDQYEQQLAKIDPQEKKKTITPTRKSKLLSELPFTARKIRSSLDHRPELQKFNRSTITKRKNSQNHVKKDQTPESTYYRYKHYKRSLSNDLKSKRMIQSHRKKKEDQEIQPWVIKGIEDDQYDHF